MKVVVIGGGPAGMMAAISSAEEKNEVTLLEKNERLGKKLLITGKGRCNITSSLPISEFINNIPGNGRFLYSAFQNYSNEDIINFLKQEGLKVKNERGNRVFPVTDKAEDVLNCFIKKMKELKIKIKLSSEVKQIIIENNKVTGIKTKNENIYCDKVILATGGKSYPNTGSTGQGYELAKRLGHTIIEPKGSIVPLKADEKICKKLQGLSLKNVKIKLQDIESKKEIYNDFGEMLFTHFGVSGPTILSSSAHLLRYKNINDKIKNEKIELNIDLKPALSEEELNNRILKDFEEFKNKEFKNSLSKLLPQKLIPVIIQLSNINEDKKVNEITKEERKKFICLLKNFKIAITGFRPVEEAIVTAGGISTKEINPKNMESKIINGLFFAGEIIDVDAYTGGFNLQIAYSTGYTSGKNY
ncbi:MAG: NAD(P)/FAD-dependent oxidoreductase [Candidatus Scatovivens sp.]